VGKINGFTKSVISATSGLALCVGTAVGLTIGLGATAPASAATPVTPQPAPVLGWNSWNHFGCTVTEQNIKDAADAIVSNGLDKLGYKYVNVDDCWMSKTRSATGHLQADSVQFPHGMKSVADYVHSKGLKFGIYESASSGTCAGRAGSLGHETTDANDFAAWGVDLLKYDNCVGDRTINDYAKRYTAMGDALKATGRAIVYSVCTTGWYDPWSSYGPASGGTMWRTADDIVNAWHNDGSTGGIGLVDDLDLQKGLEVFSGPNAWNDMDMLEVGNTASNGNLPRLTDTESRTQFSLWALLNSPLILGNDLTSMSDATKTTIKNSDVIAVDQDWGGSQGRLMRDLGNGLQVWAKPMSDGSVAVVLLNRSGSAADITTSAADIGLGGSSSYSLDDLWNKTTSTSTGAITAKSVPSHGVAMYRVRRTGSTTATTPSAGTHQVGDLSRLASSIGWGSIQTDKSVGGNTLSIGGTTYAKGIGTHADSGIHVWLGKACPVFTAQVGVDDEVGTNGTVRFQVYGDGKLLTYSNVKQGGHAATTLNASTNRVNDLELRVTPASTGTFNGTPAGIDYDHADWANVSVSCGAPITSGQSGNKCVDDNDNKTLSGSTMVPVQIWDCNTTAAQMWRYTGGTLQIDNKCMDVYQQQTTNYAPVQVYTCNGQGNQQWAPQSDGSLRAVQATNTPGNSPKCLDDPNFNTTNGTQLIIFDCNGGSNQKWKLP
jgi:alpha-galactosidase